MSIFKITDLSKPRSLKGILTGHITNAIRSKLPPEVGQAVQLYKEAKRGFSGVQNFLDANLIRRNFPNRFSGKEIDNYWTTPTPLFGGISPAEAKQMVMQWDNISLASKKLYLIEINDISPSSSFSFGLDNNLFQLFVTDIDYSPITIPAEKLNVGSAVIDGVKTTEHVEMRLSTYDDATGTLKRWMDYKASQIAPSDGTVGVPADYLCKVRVLHNFHSDKTNKGGYENKYYMRPVSSELGLSRAEGGKQVLQLVFTQFDTQLAV